MHMLLVVHLSLPYLTFGVSSH